MPIFGPDDLTPETDEPFHPVLGPSERLRFSDAGGLTQFGAYVETLSPGSQSSLCHWHAREDEFIYVLEGEITLHEGGTTRPLLPGQAATFRAGDPAGHFLVNRSSAPARYLVVGTRTGADTVTYPDHDRILIAEAPGRFRFTTLDGQPAADSAYDITAR
jgi:uncharacterized cupin superfamily protein